MKNIKLDVKGKEYNRKYKYIHGNCKEVWIELRETRSSASLTLKPSQAEKYLKRREKTHVIYNESFNLFPTGKYFKVIRKGA